MRPVAALMMRKWNLANCDGGENAELVDVDDDDDDDDDDDVDVWETTHRANAAPQTAAEVANTCFSSSIEHAGANTSNSRSHVSSKSSNSPSASIVTVSVSIPAS